LSKPQSNKDNNNKDATSMKDGNHDIVLFTMVAVGAYNVVSGGKDRGSSHSMTAWRAEPATGQGGAWRTLRGGQGHHLPRLIYHYLAGEENEQKNNVPADTERSF
jgi:hypothetical protein